MALVVQVPKNDRQMDEVRQLMYSFLEWHREYNRKNQNLIDQYFDQIAFGEEIASLPAKYEPPHGQLLYATWEGESVGCAALRQIDTKACEMKRMFVYPEFQGKGIGRSLAGELFQEARNMNYQYMRLDTSVDQVGARSLYQSLGFKVIEPYYELTEELKSWLVFMELKL